MTSIHHTAAFLASVLLLSCVNATDTQMETARTGTINLSGGTNNDLASGLIYIIPILLAIIVLDFAIFGTFATRSDELNPVSKFFFHAREGLHILRNRRTRYGVYGPSQRAQHQPHPHAQAGPAPHRVAR